MRPSIRILPALLLALAVLVAAPFAAGPVRAASGDPGAAQIDILDGALLDCMKQGKALGVKGRYRLLAPVMAKVFDLPTMTRFAVGPAWNSFTPAQQQEVLQAFSRMSIASYAHNFSSYNGETFVLDPNIQDRGPDKIVQTRMTRTNDSPVNLTYRMRQTGGVWKVIDVYFGSISQLTTRRSDFAAPIDSGGARGLIAHLNTLTDNQLQ